MKVVQKAPALLSFSNKQPSVCHMNGWSLKSGLTGDQTALNDNCGRFSHYLTEIIMKHYAYKYVAVLVNYD